MKSLWSDADAEALVRHYEDSGVDAHLALRLYTSRLLGSEPRLVQHGGGNTSLKTRRRDVFGKELDVLCVKGSGWDLSAIEPAGLPAVRLQPLLELRALESLSDEAMVNAQRTALLDASAPNPSVETLLHAWIRPAYIDHTHANAILALTDQPDGEALCRDLYGERLAVAPYCMPGFALAKLAAQVVEANPQAEGLILLKHGLFTWGANARESYERMIAFVDMAERRLAMSRKTRAPRGTVQEPVPGAMAAPFLRGALARSLGAGRWERWILDFRADAAILEFLNGRDLEHYSQRGPITPDHVIRTKPWPLIVPAPDAARLERLGEQARRAVQAYEQRYRAYFDRNNARAVPKRRMLDPVPRVALVPGVGLFGAGRSKAEAKIAADIAVATIEVIAAAEGLDRYESISEADIFAMEYWPLEQAKLGQQKPKPLAGQIIAVTGGGGTIGAAIARAFAAEGAEVAVLDKDLGAARRVADQVKGLAVFCDVTDQRAVERAFTAIAEFYGGLDVLVSNAGAAWTGKIGEVEECVLRESFELNFFAHQRVAQASVRLMRQQGTGGCLLFNVSKQAVNPGPDFGPYGLPKAATLSLARQYAVDYGAIAIRSNAVNADRIRSGLLSDDMLRARAAARNLSERDYMSGNLLGQEVTAEDVAKVFVSLAQADRTTAAALTVDGGNIAAALR